MTIRYPGGHELWRDGGLKDPSKCCNSLEEVKEYLAELA